MRKHDSPVAGEAGEPPKPMRKHTSYSSGETRAFKRAARVGWVGKAPAPPRASYRTAPCLERARRADIGLRDRISGDGGGQVLSPGDNISRYRIGLRVAPPSVNVRRRELPDLSNRETKAARGQSCSEARRGIVAIAASSRSPFRGGQEPTRFIVSDSSRGFLAPIALASRNGPR